MPATRKGRLLGCGPAGPRSPKGETTLTWSPTIDPQASGPARARPRCRAACRAGRRLVGVARAARAGITLRAGEPLQLAAPPPAAGRSVTVPMVAGSIPLSTRAGELLPGGEHHLVVEEGGGPDHAGDREHLVADLRASR